jgi:coenzyme F420-reducing hydrogenase delta subunit
MIAENDSQGRQFQPRILVFSTHSISDIGIDLAGSSHMHYPPSTVVLPLPCSSGIKPGWVLYALREGFDGVFIAADGTDCPFLPDCTARTARISDRAQALLRENGMKAERVKMAAICSVCAEAFVRHINSFFETLKGLGPAKRSG